MIRSAWTETWSLLAWGFRGWLEYPEWTPLDTIVWTLNFVLVVTLIAQ